MKTSKSSWFWGVGCLAVGLSCFAPRASWADKASAGGKRTSPPGVTVNVARLSEALKGSDATEIQRALTQAKAAGKGASPLAPAIEELLRRGSSLEIVALAIATLGDIGGPNSAAAIRPYAHHRSADIRKKALGALIKTGGPTAVGSMREGLSDPDPGVRGVAASGIGTLKGHDAMSDLFSALDHQVTEAAASIGQLCTGEECEMFAGKTGRFGLDVMTSGFDQILFRPTTEVPDDEKIRVVGRVRELGTQEANKYLRDLQSRWPAVGSARVKQAIDQAVLATAGSPS